MLAYQIIPSFAGLVSHLIEKYSENEYWVELFSVTRTWSSGVLGLIRYESLNIKVTFCHVLLALNCVKLAGIL